MRAAGVVGSARGLVPFGHVCWGYADRDEFRARAAEYVADGLAAGQWIEYIGDGDADELRREFAALPDGPELLDAGRVGVYGLDECFRIGPDGIVDPQRTVALRLAAAEQALADGFSGVRAIHDATSLARTPQQREALVRLEHLIDRKMSVLPASALCAYDVAELGPTTVTELASVHPYVNGDVTHFRLYADEDTGLALAGELDLASDELFVQTLTRTLAAREPGEGARALDVDVHGLGFADHRAILAMDAAARANERQLVLHAASPILRKLAGLLGTENLQFANKNGEA